MCCQLGPLPSKAMPCHGHATPRHASLSLSLPLMYVCMHNTACTSGEGEMGASGLRPSLCRPTDRQTAGPIRCHDAGPTGGVLLFLCLLRGFWALGEHKAKARHLLALVLLSSPLPSLSLSLSLALCASGGQGCCFLLRWTTEQQAWQAGIAWHDGRSDLTSDD